jgi:hypothetical protein
VRVDRKEWEGKKCEKGRKRWVDGMEERKRDGFCCERF